MSYPVEIVGAVASVIAIAGAVLNNKKMIACFILWAVSNALSALIHISAGVWSLAIRDLIFLILAIHGFIKWRENQ